MLTALLKTFVAAFVTMGEVWKPLSIQTIQHMINEWNPSPVIVTHGGKVWSGEGWQLDTADDKLKHSPLIIQWMPDGSDIHTHVMTARYRQFDDKKDDVYFIVQTAEQHASGTPECLFVIEMDASALDDLEDEALIALDEPEPEVIPPVEPEPQTDMARLNTDGEPVPMVPTVQPEPVKVTKQAKPKTTKK